MVGEGNRDWYVVSVVEWGEGMGLMSVCLMRVGLMRVGEGNRD